MALIANRKSVMTLFTGFSDLQSHRVRIVLAEKGINFESVEVDPAHPPEDLLELNPYHAMPTLVDRELVLYDMQVIMEYLDERFPHPPLMPVDPVSRARTRMTIRRMQQDWDPLLEKLATVTGKEATKTRKELSESLTLIAPIFDQKPYFMSDELTLLDCAIGPVLWRLPSLNIDLPEKSAGMKTYGKRLFALNSFRSSLTDLERDMA